MFCFDGARTAYCRAHIIQQTPCAAYQQRHGAKERFFMNEPTAESRETRLRRLVYQSSYTGMKETDLLLGRFAKLHLHGLTDDELGQYEALLDAGDDRIYAWVVAGEPAPQMHDNRVLDLIKEFKND
jgi:succinate dehydrogenase flavin-adding protein (antitoxin of CptAB toxin-antitoxin module)